MTVRFGSWRKKTRKFDRWRSASPNDTCFVVTGKGDAAQGWHLVLAELGSVADTGPMGVVRPGREQCDRHKLTAWIKALVAVVTALVSVGCHRFSKPRATRVGYLTRTGDSQRKADPEGRRSPRR
jgi:hypothetical protein